MNFIVTNWKTSAAGLIVILLGALGTFAGIKVPGFDLEFLAALTAGIGLILAKDGNVTGGTVNQ
jgi:hypothetical protein